MKKLITSLVLAVVISLAVIGPVAEAPAEAQPLAGYCCDSSWVHRCVLQPPAPPGYQCFCYGQGYGVTCY